MSESPDEKPINESSSLVPYLRQELSKEIQPIDDRIADPQTSLSDMRELLALRQEIIYQNNEIMKQEASLDLYATMRSDKEKNNQSVRNSKERRDVYKIVLSASAVIGGFALSLLGSSEPGMFMMGLGLASGLDFSLKDVGDFLGGGKR